jgi:glycine cleavage system H protein
MRSLFTFSRRFSSAANGAAVNSIKRYTADHEWVERVAPNKFRVGVTDYGQNALGDLVYVELPKIGTSLKQKEVLGIVESVKGASDVYAPVSGRIVAVNDQATAKPSIVNKSPEHDGWLCEIESAAESTEHDEHGGLYDKKGYDDYCQGKSQ